MEDNPNIFFDFDIKLYEHEVKMKGYCSNVHVVFRDGTKYLVCFYDPVRLQQDIAYDGFIAEPGLIIIEDVTLVNMEKAVLALFKTRYFESLKPVS